jgi:RIO kinase 1
VSFPELYDDELTETSEFDEFIEAEWITEVLQELKSGKEGTVYCCRAAPRTGYDLLAIKVYRSSRHRLFRNNAVYQEGRWIGDRRLERAVAKKTKTGRSFRSDSWVSQEYEALERLHAAGASVPRPLARNGQSLLMEFIGDEDGPAPSIHSATESRDAALAIFRRILDEIALWLANGLIHADLSPYNILYWDGRPVAIDFPQAVDPESNPRAQELLTRDVANVCRYAARYGIRADAEGIALDLWRRFGPRDRYFV